MNYILLAAPISNEFFLFLKEKNFEILMLEIFLANKEKYYTSISGIVTSNKLHLQKNELKYYSNLRWIARLGSGMEIIDTVYCDEKNIKYFSSPNGISNAVAEHTMGMLLSLLHKINIAHNEVKEGKWIRESNRGIELESLTVGIIGYGHTGKAFAKKLKSFTENILVFDKMKMNIEDEIIQETTLEILQQKADIISFHVPLNAETKYYYNNDFLQKMNKNHLLINTSRGEIVHTNTILKGLESKKILGACLDVLEEEKNIKKILNEKNNTIQQLLQYNTIITPHIAGYTHNAIEKMSKELMVSFQNIL